MEMSENTIKKTYFIGGLWNYAASLLFAGLLVFYSDGLLMFVSELPTGINLLWFWISCAAIFLFGTGYLMASMDPVLNRSIILLGVAGKIIVLSLAIYFVTVNQASLLFLGAGIVDLIFSVLFIFCYRSTLKNYC